MATRKASATRSASLRAMWQDPEEHARRSAALKGVSGRKLFTHCSWCGEALPPRERGKTGKAARFCSRRCGSASYRAYHLFAQYGLTNEQYAERLVAQGGVCAVCGGAETFAGGRGGTPGAFHVDHDHETGEVRGLVCALCNRMLGQSRDNPATLRAGADYLERCRH